MLFLTPNRQRQSTEGIITTITTIFRIKNNYNNNNDRLTAFDPGQPG